MHFERSFSIFKVFILLVISCIPTDYFAQSKKIIDSINDIPFPIKIEKSATLDKVYLKNRSDSKTLKYKNGEAKSLSNLSLIYYYQGEHEKDVEFSLKAIQLFEQIGDKQSLAYEYAELGYRMKSRNLEKAQEYMLKGKSIAEKQQFKAILSSIYNNYGVIKEMKLEYDSAIVYYQRGLIYKEQQKDLIGITYSLNNLAGVYVLLKKFPEAKKMYDRSFQLRVKLKDNTGLAENHSYYGDFYLAQNKYLAAISAYEKSVELANKSNYPELMKFGYKQLALCYEKLGKSKESLDYFKKFNTLSESLVQESTQHKIAELEVRFDTNEKEKIILQKEIEVKQFQNKLIAVSAGMILLLVLAGFVYRQQKLKQKQQKQAFELKTTKLELEKQYELEEQRQTISRDLHDNIGAQLTFIISSVENLSFGGQITHPNSLSRIEKISHFTKATIVDLRDTIWAMNSAEFSFVDFKSRLTNFISKAKFAKEDVQFQFEISEQSKQLHFSSSTGIHLYRVIQEAVNNSIKYANASEIKVDITVQNKKLIIQIQDNGCGFNMNEVMNGNGLYNMQKRMEEINGEFNLTSSERNGTKIVLLISDLEFANA